ncbi:MAG: Rap1a/Tai family immunity protein, partial [Betaproteobacteria bacterium]|nr:Rap1a/Tai family immunity protein [Betaproteobacteria bacterium]
LTFAALLALAGPALAASPPHFQVRNTADLVRVCSTDPGDEYYASAIAFCHGFGVGAYRYYEAMTVAANRFVCLPNPASTRAKVINDFLTWAGTHSEHLEKPAVDTLFRYLGGAYPCKK